MTKLFAEAGGVKLVIADAQQDNSKQVAQVETFIRQKPDLLIVAPNERAALTAVMGQAMEAHIPVICLERDILQPNYTTYIHSDNTDIGRLAGQFIVDYLTKKYGAAKGNVVQMRGLLGVEGEIKRDGGAKEILAKYPDIHIVAEPVADWIQAKAKDRMTEVLRAQPSDRCLVRPQRSDGGRRVSGGEGAGSRKGDRVHRRRWFGGRGGRRQESGGRNSGRDVCLSFVRR